MAKLTERKRNEIIKAYRKPGHPAAFSGPGNISKIFNISKKAATKVLEHIDSRTLHREYHRPPIYNPYYVFHRRELIQGDLIDMQKVSQSNDNIKFVLVLIDVFTKKVWLYPLHNKSAEETSARIREWLENLNTKPRILQSDLGTEFTNNKVQQILRSFNVEWQAATGTIKAAVVERVNRTLKTMIFTYLSDREKLRYIDVLHLIKRSYNNKPHRSLKGLTPNEADKIRNELLVRGIHMMRYAKIEEKRKLDLPLELGNTVRIKTSASGVSSSRRIYAEQFHGEYFRITRINRSMPIAMYYVQSLDSGEHIEDGFYAQELQRVRGDIFKVERVLKRRVRRGVPEILVKWQFFSSKHNEWIPEANIVEEY